MTKLRPFRTPPLTGKQVGWFRPAGAVLLAMVIPAVLAIFIILTGGPTISGPPKDGSGYTLADHAAIILACLASSVVVSWAMAPLALLGLRAAAMLGWAGWGTAVLSALVFGLPMVHVILHGDLTTEENAILTHVTISIALLGLSVWAAFWGLIWLSEKRSSTPSG